MSQKNVYILGAGFSKEAGAPLLDKFLSTAIDLYSNEIAPFDDYDKKMFKNVLNYYDELSSARIKINFDINNLETFFSIIDMNTSYITDESQRNEIYEIRNALIYLIIKTLESTIKPIIFGQDGNVLERFIKALTENQLYNHSIITFNYDLIIEKLLQKKGKMYNYGFDTPKT